MKMCICRFNRSIFSLGNKAYEMLQSLASLCEDAGEAICGILLIITYIYCFIDGGFSIEAFFAALVLAYVVMCIGFFLMNMLSVGLSIVAIIMFGLAHHIYSRCDEYIYIQETKERLAKEKAFRMEREYKERMRKEAEEAARLEAERKAKEEEWKRRREEEQRRREQQRKAEENSKENELKDAEDEIGWKPGMTEADVKKIFRKLAKQYHPDNCQGSGATFKKKKNAYDIVMKAHYNK